MYSGAHTHTPRVLVASSTAVLFNTNKLGVLERSGYKYKYYGLLLYSTEIVEMVITRADLATRGKWSFDHIRKWLPHAEIHYSTPTHTT